MALNPVAATSRNGNGADVGGGRDSYTIYIPSSTASASSSMPSGIGTTTSPYSSASTKNPVVPTTSVVTFDDSPFIGQQLVRQDRVILTDPSLPPQLLWWSANSSVKLDGFTWYIGQNGNDNPNQAFTGDHKSNHLEGLGRVQAAIPSGYTGSPLPSQGALEGLVIDLAKFSTDDKDSLNQLMNIHVNWTSNGQKGYSISGLFGIANSTDARESLASVIGSSTLKPTEVYREPPDDGIASNSLMPSATSNSAPDVNPGASSLDSNPDGDHGGGLSTGAKAGIGVACGVVGLALIAALIFFLMRRRRNNTLTPGYKDEQSTTAFVGDKGPHSATHTLNGGAPTSHSFRDDIHHHQQQMPLNGAAARTIDASHSSSDDATDPYHPYQDLPPHGAVMRSQTSGSRHDVSSLGGPETPSGLPHNVAHLVEDGMTEDDIRRLEREERELDDDLERAGRR